MIESSSKLNSGGNSMNLYLVQHGQSKPKEEDPDRPLTETGQESAKKVALFASGNMKIRLKSITHSGKTRAQQTAGILAEHLSSAEGVKAAEGLQPLDNPSIWADRLKETEDDIMLVGHLPHLSKLASLLVCGNADCEIIKFSNAGIVSLGKDDSGDWSVSWILIPEMIR
jgi:phosphohistidine phosphatase